MYLALADRNMQVRFGLKVVWESWVRAFDLWPFDLVKSNIPVLHSLSSEGVQNFTKISGVFSNLNFFQNIKIKWFLPLLAFTLLILRLWVVLKTSVASMTSTDMITSLASMTSTASLASNDKKQHALYIRSDFLAWETLAASMTSTASTTSVTSMTSSASFHQKNYWAWFFHQPWHQNDLLWSDNVWLDHQKLTIFLIFDTLSFGGCGGQGCYF